MIWILINSPQISGITTFDSKIQCVRPTEWLINRTPGRDQRILFDRLGVSRKRIEGSIFFGFPLIRTQEQSCEILHRPIWCLIKPYVNLWFLCGNVNISHIFCQTFCQFSKIFPAYFVKHFVNFQKLWYAFKQSWKFCRFEGD